MFADTAPLIHKTLKIQCYTGKNNVILLMTKKHTHTIEQNQSRTYLQDLCKIKRKQNAK